MMRWLILCLVLVAAGCWAPRFASEEWRALDARWSQPLPAQQGELQRNVRRNGNAHSEGYVVNGVREGLWRFYHDDGSPSALQYYRSGRLHGERLEWTKGGTLTERSEWVDDLAHGCFEAWHETGTKAATGSYDRGVASGDWRRWDASGQVSKQ